MNNQLTHIFIVGAGGAIGAILRFKLSNLITQNYLFYKFPNLPLNTFIINILGCLFVGIISGLILKYNNISYELKIFCITGLAGGFTTFSAFCLENFNLIKTGNLYTVILYSLLSIILGIVCIFIGLYLTSKI